MVNRVGRYKLPFNSAISSKSERANFSSCEYIIPLGLGYNQIIHIHLSCPQSSVNLFVPFISPFNDRKTGYHSPIMSTCCLYWFYAIELSSHMYKTDNSNSKTQKETCDLVEMYLDKERAHIKNMSI